MLTTLTLLCVLVSFVLFWFQRRFSYWRRHGVKEWKAISIFGNFKKVIFLNGNEADIADECYKQLGEVDFGGYYFLWKPIIMVKDPAMIKNIMIKHFDHFIDHPDFLDIQMGTDKICKGLFFLKSDEWKNKRSAMTALFTPKRHKKVHTDVQGLMKGVFDKFDKQSKFCIDVQVEDAMADLFSHVILRSFIGVDIKDMQVFREAQDLFAQPGFWNVIKMTLFNIHPEILKTLRLTTLPKEIFEVFENLTERVMAQRKKENIVAEDLFDFLIRCKKGEIPEFKGVSREELYANVFTFFSAGHDTTALTTGFVFYELSRNPEIQERLRGEFKKKLKQEGNLSYESLNQIPYLNCIINETQRMYPILGVIKRICTKPYKLGQFDIPVGMEVIIPSRSLQNDPKYFDEPEIFKPERFLDGRSYSEVFMPFGIGPRTCIGLRFAEVTMKVTIASVLLNYELLPSIKNKLPFTYGPSTIVTVRPVGGLWIKLKKIIKS